MNREDYNYYYRLWIEEKELNEFLVLIIIGLIAFLLLAISRNIYNAFKKSSYRKSLKNLKVELSTMISQFNEQQSTLQHYDKLKHNFEHKTLQLQILQEELTEKEQELLQQKELNKHQRHALEKYADYKAVDANNTRLGAHFIKNVLSHIYQELETSKMASKSVLGIKVRNGESKVARLSIKALKNMFQLLDYNVASVNQFSVTLEEESKYLQHFIDLIIYLKPKTSIKLVDNIGQNNKGNIKIRPTLLFPFMENALKHGNLNNEDSYINIDISIKNNNVLCFRVVNTCEHNLNTGKQPETPFGLVALRQLLKTYYPKGTLDFELHTNNTYSSQITIPF